MLGNINAAMCNAGGSNLAEGCNAQSCLVDLRKALGQLAAAFFSRPNLRG